MSSRSQAQVQAPPDLTDTNTRTTHTGGTTPSPASTASTTVIDPVEFNSPFTPGETFSSPVTRTIFVTTSSSSLERVRFLQQQQQQHISTNTNSVAGGMLSSGASRNGDGVGGFRTPHYHQGQPQQEEDMGSNSPHQTCTTNTTNTANPISNPSGSSMYIPSEEPEPTVSFRLHCHPHYVRRTELPVQLRRLKRSWSVPEIYGVSESLSQSEVTGTSNYNDGNGGGDGGEGRGNGHGGISELMRYREVCS